MRSTIILRHMLPDGSEHYDWLIQREQGDALICFRLEDRVDLAGPPGFTAQRIGDHRPVYLTYEGPITGGRGIVVRVAAGQCRVRAEGRDHLSLDLDLGRLQGSWEGRLTAGAGAGTWSFRSVGSGV